MTDAIKNFYSGYSEDERLFKDNSHNIKFLTSMQYLERVISSNSVILDACAGAGAYSFALAERDHVGTACDLMPKHVEQLHKQNDSLHLLQI